MPVVVRTRPYDRTFYAQVGQTAWEELPSDRVLPAAAQAKAALGL